jgi:phosphoribosylformylglycinamidine synthase subunit PurQ / glutaminase
MKAAVITFPGSNCDRDLAVAFRQAGAQVARVWHKDTALPPGTDIVGIPGGFSFGDYLRCGAIAARSPIGQAVVDHAARVATRNSTVRQTKVSPALRISAPGRRPISVNT